MIGPRAPQENEFPEILDFFTKHLRPEQSWSIAAEYPSALNLGNLGNIRMIKDGEKILSGAVNKNLIIKNPVGVFKVAGIGSVVTAPDYRGQGHSRAVMESCTQTAKEQGCDFAILWTDLFEFYQKLGFEVAGSEISLMLEDELPVAATAHKIIQSNKVAPESLLKLYVRHTTGTVRTVEDVRRSLTIPNSKVFTMWDASNNLLAYAVEGKGADLQNYIHEWGGDVTPLIQLFAHMRKTYQRPLTVIAPAHASNLIRRLTDLGVLANEGFLGMIKLLNFENLLFKIKRYARHLGIDDLIFEFREGAFFMGTGQHIFKTDSQADITRLIFGPMRVEQVPAFDKHTQEVLGQVLPIPMWVWGWDSI